MSAQTCAAGTDDDYARLVASVFETRIDPLADAAERCRQFPREVFEILGREGCSRASGHGRTDRISAEWSRSRSTWAAPVPPGSVSV